MIHLLKLFKIRGLENSFASQVFLFCKNNLPVDVCFIADVWKILFLFTERTAYREAH